MFKQNSQRQRSDRAVVVVALVVVLTVGALKEAKGQPLLVFPTQNSSATYQPLREACLNPGLWPTGWQRSQMFGNSVQFWSYWPSDAEIAQCFTNLRNAGKSLVIEAGALKPGCQTAQACLDGSMATFSRLAGLGLPDTYLAIDEPISTGHPNWPAQKANYAYAVQQTVEYIRLVRALAPGLKFILHEAYPNNSASTLTSFFQDVHYGALAQTGMGIQYASVDHDWNAGGNLGDLLTIQNGVRSAGIGFSVVFWGAGPTGPSQWYNGLQNQGQMYQAWRPFGLSPDLYSVLNWTGQPTTTLNETTPLSFTRSVRDFVHRFLPTVSLAPNTMLTAGQSKTSPDGRFMLVYQSDGNLVLYGPSGWIWHSNTYGTSPGRAEMQGDGNLIVYDASGAWKWQSGTNGNNGAFLSVQSDGNMVVYSSYVNSPLWASNTNWY